MAMMLARTRAGAAMAWPGLQRAGTVGARRNFHYERLRQALANAKAIQGLGDLNATQKILYAHLADPAQKVPQSCG